MWFEFIDIIAHEKWFQAYMIIKELIFIIIELFYVNKPIIVIEFLVNILK